MHNGLREDAPSILLRGYDVESHIWKRARSEARAAPMRLLGQNAMFVRGTEGVPVFYPRTEILDTGLDVDRRRLPTKPASGGCMHALTQERRSGS
jgi:hypothetical protein